MNKVGAASSNNLKNWCDDRSENYSNRIQMVVVEVVKSFNFSLFLKN